MSQQQNPFDDESLSFYVLINAEQQYSLWPTFAPIPAGWQVDFGPESRELCISQIELKWQDMRPASLRAVDHLEG